MTDYNTQATVSPVLPASLFSDAELVSITIASGLDWQREGDDLYFFADTFFDEKGEDEQGETVDLLALLQSKLRQLDTSAYPHIVINGACWCSKMRPDEFGGFAYVITRDDVRHINTWQWLEEQTRTAPSPAAAE
jgi:hypothetical protein